MLQNRLRKEGEISVEEINSHLDGIADANSVGGDEKKGMNRCTGCFCSIAPTLNFVYQRWVEHVVK